VTIPSDPAALIAGIGDELPVAIWVGRAPDGESIYANRALAEMIGSDEALRTPFARALAERRIVTCEEVVTHDGRRVHVRAVARPVQDDTGAISHVVIACFDVTREREAQARERMAATGRLAGGVAHDFNNLLTAIRAMSSRLREREHDPQRLSDLAIIDDAAARAAELTRALLGIAGKGTRLSETISLHALAESLLPQLRRALDPRIELQLELGAAHDEIAADAPQLEQVLSTLVRRAREAMVEGGRLVLRTRNLERSDDVGPQVVLEVCDTGAGIDRHRLFEPYFESGLHFASAYGIVQGHRGTIEALDAQPRGTIVRLTFPLANATGARRAMPPHEAARAEAGTILLVEDEPLVRVATFRTLKQLGYRVIACADGDEAVEIFRERHGEITAVMLDMRMPRMSGPQTYVAMRAIDPTVRVLLTTGLAHNDEVQRILSLGVRSFLAKPYEPASLSQALVKVIEDR
jgi:signal transduction histidine kinase/CheY-like chemotaxis protein